MTSVRVIDERVPMHLQTAFVQRGSMHDVPRDDHGALPLRASLDCIGGHSKQIAAKIVYGENAGDKRVRHGNRFDYRQVPAHFCGPPDRVRPSGEHDGLYPKPSNHDVRYRHSAFAALTNLNTPKAAKYRTNIEPAAHLSRGAA